MVQERLDLQLTDELGQQVVLHYLLLVHLLQRHDHPRTYLAGQAHHAELALAQVPDYLEVLLR